MAPTPTACAETPTHAAPSLMIALCPEPQSGALSRPGDTFSHSTNTVPLNCAARLGRYTTMRVLYGAVACDVTDQRPSEVSGCAEVYAVAVPSRKYSSLV